MATKIRKRTNPKKIIRFKHKARIRSKVTGTAERPRLAVFRSNQHLYVQLIDDVKMHTLVAATTKEEGKLRSNLSGAKWVGETVAKRATAKGILKVVFDRSGYAYHGRMKALADAAREGGLKF